MFAAKKSMSTIPCAGGDAFALDKKSRHMAGSGLRIRISKDRQPAKATGFILGECPGFRLDRKACERFRCLTVHVTPPNLAVSTAPV